jgi:hypothetical protein
MGLTRLTPFFNASLIEAGVSRSVALSNRRDGFVLFGYFLVLLYC